MEEFSRSNNYLKIVLTAFLRLSVLPTFLI